MLSILWTASVLATAVLAAPFHSPVPGHLDEISTSSQLLALKIEERQDEGGDSACDLNNAQMPQSSPALPLPTGLTLKHVAIGRGTQNYRCSPNNPTAIPVAIGAIATLYNANCIAATNPQFLAEIPNLALQYNPNSEDDGGSILDNLGVSGHHFFLDKMTPFFNLDTDQMTLGQAACTKNASVPAPANAPIGQGGQGFGAVPWLQLLTKPGATGNLKEVYRLNTAGGKPPPDCSNMAATFKVQYAAEYWFWAGI